MDKQKQIEEIAEIIRVNCGECNTCKYIDELHCADLLSAEELYNAGYRKIPENAVVLTNKKLELGEYKGEVQVMSMTRRVYDAILAQARKETAEKFAERLKESEPIKRIVDDGWIVSYVEICNVIDEICKEFTEGKE